MAAGRTPSTPIWNASPSSWAAATASTSSGQASSRADRRNAHIAAGAVLLRPYDRNGQPPRHQETRNLRQAAQHGESGRGAECGITGSEGGHRQS
jgi:hypothetical protein